MFWLLIGTLTVCFGIFLVYQGLHNFNMEPVLYTGAALIVFPVFFGFVWLLCWGLSLGQMVS